MTCCLQKYEPSYRAEDCSQPCESLPSEPEVSIRYVQGSTWVKTLHVSIRATASPLGIQPTEAQATKKLWRLWQQLLDREQATPRRQPLMSNYCTFMPHGLPCERVFSFQMLALFFLYSQIKLSHSVNMLLLRSSITHWHKGTNYVNMDLNKLDVLFSSSNLQWVRTSVCTKTRVCLENRKQMIILCIPWFCLGTH